MLVNMNIINFTIKGSTMNLPKYKQSSVDKLLVHHGCANISLEILA